MKAFEAMPHPPEPLQAEHVRARIEAAAGDFIELAFHENPSVLASVRPGEDGGWNVRLHGVFLHAPVSVLQHLGMYLRTRRKAFWKTVRDYARHLQSSDAIPVGRRSVAVRQAVSRGKGRFVDLEAILREVNENEFMGRYGTVAIIWGKNARAQGRQRRSIRFGSFHAATNVIRIHPSLDRSDAPQEFLRYLVFHELLHAEFPPQRKGGRWIYHSREFKQRERQYPGFERMREMMSELMRAAA